MILPNLSQIARKLVRNAGYLGPDQGDFNLRTPKTLAPVAKAARAKGIHDPSIMSLGYQSVPNHRFGVWE